MRIDTETISVARSTKGKLPSLPFVDISTAILGKKFELSIVFITENQSQNLNNIHRQKNYPTNVLSFPLSDTSGEIYICLKKVRSEAKDFDKTYIDFLLHIVIHGMLHVKGFDHGEAMDKLEEKYIKRFTKLISVI